MERSRWEAISSTIRNMIIATFKMAEIDFEREYVISNETSPRQFEMSPWMTRREAAKYARVSTDTIDNWCTAGHIKKSKLGVGRPGSVLIDRDSLEKFLRSRIVNDAKYDRKAVPSVKGGYRVQRAK